MKLIKGVSRIHLLFEQSGTFKNAFRSLGYEAFDYDIQNNFGETDNVIDLFEEIERAHRFIGSIFDNMKPNDLIMAFFPCIYFCDPSQCAFRLDHINYRKMPLVAIEDKILKRNADREHFFNLAVKMVFAALRRELRLIMENPWSGEHYLKSNFLKRPDIIDTDRTKRGDRFRKPTAYWFFGCSPTRCETKDENMDKLRVYDCKSAPHEGLCSETRSLITPEYARNFIADFILGEPCGTKPQQGELALL